MKKNHLFTLIFTLLTAVACPPPPPVVPENPTDTDGTEIVYRFEPNGGSGSAFDYTVRFAEEFTFPENPFIKENYAFVGWSTNKNATSSNQLSQPGERELVSSGSPYTYYAIWERGRMTVTYNPMVENGKTVTVDALNQDGYIVLADGDALFAVKESGKYFAGWRKTADESGDILGPGTAIKVDGTPLTFYAAYLSAKPETKTVWFRTDSTSGWVVDAESSSYTINEHTQSILLPDVKESYPGVDITADFLGWALTDNAAEAEYLPGETISSSVLLNGSSGNIDIFVYAVLKERQQSTVKFDLNTEENPGAEWNPNSSDYYSKPSYYWGGNELPLPSDRDTVSHNEEIRLFGWEWNGTVYKSGETFTVPAESDITFTAVWKTPVAVKWNLNGARMSDYYKIIVADDPDVDADRNGVADELESALPGDEILFSDDMLRLMCTKPPLEGKAWGLDGIQIKKTKSGQTVNVTRTVDSYYYDEYDFVLHYTQYAFVMPEEEVEVSLIWKEVPAELDLKILDSDSSSLVIADPGTVSLDTENFSVVNKAGEKQIFSTYFGELRYLGFVDAPLAPGEYRLQFVVDGAVKSETSFTVKGEETQAPLEFAFGEAAVTVEDNHYVLTVAYTHNRGNSLNYDFTLSVNGTPEQDKYASVDTEKQTVTFDYLYGDEYNPDDKLTVTATVEGQEFSVTATVPADDFCLYPSNKTAQIALFRESESSSVSVSVPIERSFGAFTDFDVTVTKEGNQDSIYNGTVYGSRKEDGLFLLEFNINNVTSGDYTLEIVPSGKASPKVECTITVNEIPVGKRIYLSPKRK